MNDEDLAHAALEILHPGAKPISVKAGHHNWKRFPWGMDSRVYVQDWRVAGPLMQKVFEHGDWRALCNLLSAWYGSKSSELPRAITKECVAYLSGDQHD